MLDTAPKKAVELTNAQGAAMRILTAIRLDLLSTACEKEAIQIMEGRDIDPSKAGNVFSQAELAVNLVLENKMGQAADDEVNKLIEQYMLAS